MADNSLSSDGLQLGGSGSANLMGTYEEGTWTPRLGKNDNTLRTFTSYTTTEGRYVKIGKMVYLYVRLRTNGIDNSGGTVTVTQLPFVAADTDSNHGSASFGYTSGWAGDVPNRGLVRDADDYLTLYYQFSSTGDTASIDGSDLSTGTDNNNFHMTAWYEAAS